jgi:hypothetical protein
MKRAMKSGHSPKKSHKKRPTSEPDPPAPKKPQTNYPMQCYGCDKKFTKADMSEHIRGGRPCCQFIETEMRPHLGYNPVDPVSYAVGPITHDANMAIKYFKMIAKTRIQLTDSRFPY